MTDIRNMVVLALFTSTVHTSYSAFLNFRYVKFACLVHLNAFVILILKVSHMALWGAAASSLGSVVGCRVEDRAIDTALGQCFIPNSSH